MFRIALEALVALVLFGGIPVAVRAVHANPYTIGIFRLAVATVVFGVFILGRGEFRRLRVRDTLRVVTIGVLFAVHWLTLFFAVKIASASIGAIGLSTYGVHLLLLGALLQRERPHASDLLAVLVAAAGAVLVVPSFALSNDIAAGMLLATLSAFLYAMLPLLHQRWSHIPTPMRTLGQFGFALAVFLLFAGRTEWTLSRADWGGLLFLAAGVTLIGHSLWVRVTTRLPPSATSIIYYGNIPIAIALGVILLDEPLTTRTVIGAAMIIGGSVIGLAAKARRNASAGQPA